MNELGRLYLWFGQLHKAISCFNSAAETAKIVFPTGAQVELINRQRRMLVANVFDSGYVVHVTIHDIR